jgi:hypothetical protein
MAQQMLAMLLLATVSMTGLLYRGSLYTGESGISGQIILPASAMEHQTLEKEVGQTVHFKASVKNTGNVETTYIVAVHWRVDGTEEWESGGITDVRLAPWQYETLVLGGIMCTESMMGKHFDVKFVLLEYETERVLDQKEIDKAWHVKETIITGTIIGFWIE